MSTSFDDFLAWLSPDRDEAARKFEQLRKKLVAFFTWGGGSVPEELFDDTVDRATRRLSEGAVARSVDPFRYCGGVAKNVLREDKTKPKLVQLEDERFDQFLKKRKPEWNEEELKCLDTCMEKLAPHDRDLVLRYFQHKGKEKIRMHRQMALEQGGANALRINMCRKKKWLFECVSDCMRKNGKEPRRM